MTKNTQEPHAAPDGNKESGKNGVGCRGRRGPGRPPGRKNKIAASVREMVETALHELGGKEWLKRQGKKKHNDAFLRLVGRLMPTDVKIDVPQVVFDPANQLEFARRVAFVLELGARQQESQPLALTHVPEPERA